MYSQSASLHSSTEGLTAERQVTNNHCDQERHSLNNPSSSSPSSPPLSEVSASKHYLEITPTIGRILDTTHPSECNDPIPRRCKRATSLHRTLACHASASRHGVGVDRELKAGRKWGRRAESGGRRTERGKADRVGDSCSGGGGIREMWLGKSFPGWNTLNATATATIF